MVDISDLPVPDSSTDISDLPVPQGSGSIFHPDPNVSRESDEPIEAGGTPLTMAVGAFNKWAGGGLAKGAQALGMSDPRSLQDVRNLPAAVEAVTPFFLGGPKRPPGAGPADHPLAAAAQSEQSSLDTMEATARSQGLELPQTTISQPQQIANRLAREDLNLPTKTENGVDAPLTSDMLHVANKQYVSPAYQAVSEYPKPIPLSDATKATLDDVRPLLPPKEVAALPSGDTITAQQGVELSKALRAKAQQFPDTGVNADMQSWSSISQAHVDAAKAIEGDIRTQLASDGQEPLADAWDAARIYRAKSGAYEQALDGAGNVQVPVLKKQLLKQGIPLSDNAELLANMGARYPKMFSSTPQVVPPGFVRRTAAAAMPAVGAAAGAHLGGPIGAVAGEALGSNLGQKLLSP